VKLQPFQINDGYSRFVDLIDTPSVLTGESGSAIVIKGTEDGLEFGSAVGGGLTDGYLSLPEISDPATEDGYLYVYAKVEDGYAELHCMDSYNLSTQLTSRGSLFTVSSDLSAPPLVPHPYDDEFESTTLDASWTEDFDSYGAGSGYPIDPYLSLSSGYARRLIHTDREKSWYLIQTPGNNTDHRLYKACTVPTNMFVWMRSRFLQRSAASTDAQISLSLESSTDGVPDDYSKFRVYHKGYNSGYSLEVVTEVDDGGPTNSGMIHDCTGEEQGYDYIGISKRGTQYTAWAFNDTGQSYCFWTATISPSTHLIDTIIIKFRSTSSAGTPGTGIFGVDFLRVSDNATFLPGRHR